MGEVTVKHMIAWIGQGWADDHLNEINRAVIARGARRMIGEKVSRNPFDEWHRGDAPFKNTEHCLPLDLTSDGGPYCDEQHWDSGASCTRLPYHTGRHAAGDSDHIVAVWH